MLGLMLFFENIVAVSPQLRSLPWQLALLALLFAAFFRKRIVRGTRPSAALPGQRDRLKVRSGEPIRERRRARGLAAGD